MELELIHMFAMQHSAFKTASIPRKSLKNLTSCGDPFKWHHPNKWHTLTFAKKRAISKITRISDTLFLVVCVIYFSVFGLYYDISAAKSRKNSTISRRNLIFFCTLWRNGWNNWILYYFDLIRHQKHVSCIFSAKITLSLLVPNKWHILTLRCLQGSVF